MTKALMNITSFHIVSDEKKNSFDAKLEYEFFNNFESPHTRKSYRSDIAQFFEFLSIHFKTVTNYELIERVHVVAFRNWLTDNELAPKSINRKIAANSSFFDFLIEKGIAKINPCSSIKRPRQEVRSPTNDLSDQEIVNLLSLFDSVTGPALLHKAVIYTLFTTGIRKAELINLRRKNFTVKDSHYLIEVKAKGGKILTKVVHPKCAEVILEFITYLESQGEKIHPEDWIFRPSRNPLDPTHIIKPLNPKSVDYIVKTWCKKAGIHHRISPHSARASYIGSALDSGIDLYKISKDVGHASVKTTEEYNKRRQNLDESPVFGLGFLNTKKTN
ncbi:MAG: tyrosine-type recombinase/integrase [Bacteriovoracaceae bacterium]|nr:tyrosine-type recombinase/integrase [Bacteriovoracaceae bacterium]